MPFDPEDKEYLKLIIESSINTAIKPTHEHLAQVDLELQEHRQTLTGIDGTNGLVSKVKKLDEFRENVNVRIAMFSGGFAVIGSIGVKIINSIFGGK